MGANLSHLPFRVTPSNRSGKETETSDGFFSRCSLSRNKVSGNEFPGWFVVYVVPTEAGVGGGVGKEDPVCMAGKTRPPYPQAPALSAKDR